MRKRVYEIIEVSKDGDKVSAFYDILRMFAIFVSIVPLAFKNPNRLFRPVDVITASLLIISST